MQAEKVVVNVLKVIGLVGILSTELTLAAADGKVTAAEGLVILEKVCNALGIDFEKAAIDVSGTES